MNLYNNISDIDRLINDAYNNPIRVKFEERMHELGITKNQAVENIETTHRSLDGILDGTLQYVDFITLLKIAEFLEMDYNELLSLFTVSMTEKHREDLQNAKKRSFIINNFDLPVLKSIGVIDNIKDIEHIESRIKQIFELGSIYDFDFEEGGIAF